LYLLSCDTVLLGVRYNKQQLLGANNNVSHSKCLILRKVLTTYLPSNNYMTVVP
jgi:hypothetical protein